MVRAGDCIATFVIRHAKFDEYAVPPDPFLVIHVQPFKRVSVGHDDARLTPGNSELADHLVGDLETFVTSKPCFELVAFEAWVLPGYVVEDAVFDGFRVHAHIPLEVEVSMPVYVGS